MRVSIVTISYNQAEFLERAIKSVIEQDYEDIEYIVVDPGSTDGSREIIERYRSKIDKIIFEPDDGPADGLNKGFAAAEGEIYSFINADDMLLPGAIRLVADQFALMPAVDVLSGHTWIIDENDRKLRRFYSRRFSLRRYAYGAAVLAQQSTFFRTAAYHRTFGFNVKNRIAWDGELWVDLALAGANFLRLDKMLACFRVYSDTISGSGRMQKEYDIYVNRIFQKIMGRKKNAIDEVVRIGMKVLEYAFDPWLFWERITEGPTIGR